MTQKQLLLKILRKIVSDVDPGWKTVNGAKVLIGENGEVVGGLGGKITGKPLSALKDVGKKSVSKPNASSAGKQTASTQSNKPKRETPKQKRERLEAEQKKIHDAAQVNLTQKEEAALKNYTGSTYRSINSTLREGKTPTGEDRKDLKQIDTAFAKANTTEPIQLYRGISGELASQLTAGSTFRDGGFSSGSSDYDTAKAYSTFGGPGGAVLDIRVPSGSKAISVRDFSQFGGATSSSKSENEIVLNRGGIYRVAEVIQDKPYFANGRRITPPPRIVVEYQDG